MSGYDLANAWKVEDIHSQGSNYTPQNNWRTNTINYNIDAFCEERILKTNFTI